MNDGLNDYLIAGERAAYALENRGPIRFDDAGALAQDILDAYWRTGFYVFEGLLGRVELGELVTDFEALLDRVPTSAESRMDRLGRSAIGREFKKFPFRFAKPLSDPHGGTKMTGGRYPVRMSEPEAPADAPPEVLLNIAGNLQLMDSALRYYAHPKLLRVAEAINGPDFTPFTDTIWLKPAGLGASVAWHQDGTTHWESPGLDRGTHGFNFMTQLYGSDVINALWVVPGTHDQGKLDIKRTVEENGSDRLPGAVPMLCAPGDVAICNRQVLHGSFANTSSNTRATLVFGFHRRASVLGVKGWAEQPYDDAHINERCDVIRLAIEARRERFPAEVPYAYAPSTEGESFAGMTPDARRARILDYNLKDIGI